MSAHVLDYESPCPTFALGFSSTSSTPSTSKSSVSSGSGIPDFKLGVGSFVEGFGGENHITVLGVDPLLGWNLENDIAKDDPSRLPHSPPSGLIPLARAQHPYPCTSLAFSPPRLASSIQSSVGGTAGTGDFREMVVTSSDCLRLWDFVGSQESSGSAPAGGYVGRERGGGNGRGYRLIQRSVLANPKADFSAPLTSFSWSTMDPSLIVTSSIDTTCTVWDISTSTAITQLIAHDREVYDVSWSPASKHVFSSVGADGSVRMFDLRSLEHSTILYEASTGSSSASKRDSTSKSAPSSSAAAATGTDGSPPAALAPAPLLRLSFNPADPNYLAVFHADASEVQVLDVRAPGSPIVELKSHRAAVNGIAWAGHGMLMASCGDDCQVLVYDLENLPSTTRSSTPTPQPILAYTAPAEVNAITWAESQKDWLAIGVGRLVRCLRV